MAERLIAAELRVSFERLDDWPLLLSMFTAAGERLVAQGAHVRYVDGTYLPHDGRALVIFAAPTIESVRRVVLAAGVPILRVAVAVPLPRLDRAKDRP